MKLIWITLSILGLVLLSGCVATPSTEFTRHAITINGDGNILAPAVDGSGFQKIGDTQRSLEYIDALFDGADHTGGDLLIFVHGGLNSLKNSTDRVNKLIGLYKAHHLDTRYPILINWDSGFFESYADHLFRIRQGEINKTVAVPTSPFYFLADLGRGVVRAPIDFGYTAVRDIQSIPGIDMKINKYRKNSHLLYQTLRQSSEDYAQNVYLGPAMEWGWQSFYKVPINILTFIPQAVLSPLVDGFGTPAWDSMQRRTKLLYNKPEEFDIKGKASRTQEALRGEPIGVMTIFAERLARYARQHPQARVTIIGHSMGTFIINELIRRYPEINYQNIVYMAGADSIRNTFTSVNPYLKAHRDAHFFNLTLQPQNEVEEPNYWLLPRGSLLVWIDDFYSLPHTQLDRTVGRWENLIQAYGDIPKDIRRQIYIKAFAQDSPIKKRGDFSNARFWEETFWTTGSKVAAPPERVEMYFNI